MTADFLDPEPSPPLRKIVQLPKALVLTTVVSLIALALPAMALESTRYDVVVDTMPTPVMRITLKLSSASGAQPVTLFSPATRLGIPLQVRNVRCDGTELKDVGGRWAMPAGCRAITWTVPLVQDGPDGILANQQQSLAMASGWYVFSDISSVLRQSPAPKAAPSISFKGPKIRSATFQLRTLREPPSYFVLGPAPGRIVHDDQLKLTYVGDDLGTIRNRIDPAQHLAGLAYYRRIMGPKVARHTDKLTVVWLPVPKSRRAYGAAAGHDTLLANYLVDPSPDDWFTPIVTALHEQFHQWTPAKTGLDG